VPLTHWQSAVQANTRIGWLSANGGGYGLLDHAGAHHINMAAGATSLVLTFLLGSQAEAVKANECFTAALWTFFGMTGYLVAGDPNSKSGGAGPTLVNVLMSVSTAVFSAVVFEVLYNGGKKYGHGTPTNATVITAINYGLVAVTSGASLISPMWAAFFGFATVLVCTILNQVLSKVKLDGLGTNSVFSIHFLGAAVSSALTGLFANPTYGGVVHAGSFYGNPIQLGRQCAGISVTLLVAVVGTIVSYAFVLLVSKAFGNITTSLAEHAEPAADKPLTAAEPVSAA
jgi:Amt family ammonium transporter